ncbi:hypothetical protein FBU30_010841 [Linnemannia zychae]|nr:hypothetical protein FBU30_010841 [Linnemannia zychae]
MPSQVLKSALALLPSIDLSRSKQFFPSSKSTTDSISMVSESGTGSKNGEVASLPSSQPLTSANTPVTVTATAGAAAPIDTATTRTDTMTSDTASEAGSSSGKSSVSSPRLDGIFNNNNHYASLAEVIENENIADYTGVWEAFDIPYSLSLPSEMVYLGQAVPLTIRFGPQRGHHSNTKQGNAHQQDSINNSNSINGDKISASLRRFVVKKGVLRLVEHTVLREVSSVQVPPNKTVAPNKNQANRNLALLTTNAHAPSQAMQEQVFEDDPANKNSSSHRRTFSEQQQSGNNTGNRSIKSRMMATFGKHQNQSAIYQEQNYHGSHSHLPFPGGGDSGTEIQQQQQNTKTRHQHQLSFPGGDAHQQQQQQQGDRRSIFKPNRHSMDVSMNPAMSGNSHSPRIVNSIEAKFKTEVMLLSLTPHLQRQERWYQHQLKNLISQTQGNSNHHAEQDKDFEDMYTEEEVAKEDIEDGVWQTTVWVSIPGPSAMATFTETKNIVKTHTFQLILLCGMSDENIPSAFTATPATDGNETEAGSAGSGSGSGSVSTVSLANVNKEFRLEMDLHVTGPRAPAEMSFRQPRKE